MTDAVATSLNQAFSGRRSPRDYAEIRNETGRISFHEVGVPSIFSTGITRKVNKNFRAKRGIYRLFDKTLYRDNDNTATNNEPGRTYYTDPPLSF